MRSGLGVLQTTGRTGRGRLVSELMLLPVAEQQNDDAPKDIVAGGGGFHDAQCLR